MPYYLAPYMGTGTDDDPFRPRSSDQSGWSAIDLRPNAGIIDGWCFLFLPAHDPDHDLILLAGTKGDRVSQGSVNKIISRLGLNMLDPDPFDVMVSQILVSPNIEFPKKIRAGRKSQALRIWLGPQGAPPLWEMKLIQGGSSLAESFNKANSDTLGPDQTWDEYTGDIDVVSNEASNGGTATGKAFVTAELATADHHCEFSVTKVATPASSFNNIGSSVRQENVADHDHYRCQIRKSSAAAWDINLIKDFAGATTQIAGPTGISAPTLPKTVRTEVNGSSVSGSFDGNTIGPTTDTDITGFKRCGIGSMKGRDAAGDVACDAWAAADLVAAGRIMSSLVNAGGLAGPGGIAGQGGGLAG